MAADGGIDDATQYKFLHMQTHRAIDSPESFGISGKSNRQGFAVALSQTQLTLRRKNGSHAMRCRQQPSIGSDGGIA